MLGHAGPDEVVFESAGSSPTKAKIGYEQGKIEKP